jgi:hypothetical protein
MYSRVSTVINHWITWLYYCSLYPPFSTGSLLGSSSWSGGRPGGDIGKSDGVPSLEEALKETCPTGAAACAEDPTCEDVGYVCECGAVPLELLLWGCAAAQLLFAGSFSPCYGRTRDRFPPPPLPTLLFPPLPPRRWRLPPLQLPGRPLWGVGVGREAANGVVKRVEVSALLVPPSYTH